MVPRNDVLAYKYFDQLVDNYDEDETDQRSLAAIANAFVQVGLYNLTGITGSAVKSDPERAVEMFEVAATRFGDADGEYHLARMFIDGAGGLEKRQAARRQMARPRRREGPSRRAGAARPHAVPRRRRAAPGGARADVAADRLLQRQGDRRSPGSTISRPRIVSAANENERNAAAAFLAARGKREIAAALSTTARATSAPVAAAPLQLTGAANPAQ